MLRLRKHLVPLLRATSHPTSSSPFSSLHLRTLSTSTSAIATTFSVEDYLVGTCGLTGAQALNASKKLSHFKSASNPDAVLALLSGVGLSRPDIAAVVAADPLLLRSRVDNIARRLSSLRNRLGLSVPQIARFLLVGGAVALRSCDVAPRLEFWIPFCGSFDKLLQTMRWSNTILTTDLEKVVKPNIALLRECGLSVCDIVKMPMASPRLLTFNPERVKAKTEFLRSTLGCSMNKLSVVVCKHPAILRLSDENLRCKIEFLRSTLGCSMDKLSVAIYKKPQILGLSEEKLCCKIEFMVTEIGFELEYIVERPVLLTYSLEKRLVPRHYVVKILQAKGLMKKGASFCPIVCYADKDFIAKYIDRHKDTVPGIADAYTTVCAGKVPATL